MSRRASKKGRRGGPEVEPGDPEVEPVGDAAGRAFYVYCVGESAALAPLFGDGLPAAIEEDAGLELIEARGLAAVASAVPLPDYGEAVLAGRISDPAWMAARAMRHELVVEHFAAAAAVVPLRFGTIYLSRESVKRTLGEKEAQLRAFVDLVRGREEWGLNVYVDRKRLREAVADVSPRLLEMKGQAEAQPPGRAYMLRKQIDALRDAEAAAVRKQVVKEVAGIAADARCTAFGSKPRRAGEKAEQGEVVARDVFLVDRERRDALHARAEEVAAKYAPLGFKMELVGPWPAYYFTEQAGATGATGEEGAAPLPGESV